MGQHRSCFVSEATFRYSENMNVNVLRCLLKSIRQATGPPRSGAGVGVGKLRDAEADIKRGPYMLYWHSQGGPMYFSDTPLFENKKVTKSPSPVFDRYEIHAQDFETLFTGIFIICRCPSLQKLIKT